MHISWWMFPASLLHANFWGFCPINQEIGAIRQRTEHWCFAGWQLSTQFLLWLKSTRDEQYMSCLLYETNIIKALLQHSGVSPWQTEGTGWAGAKRMGLCVLPQLPPFSPLTSNRYHETESSSAQGECSTMSKKKQKSQTNLSYGFPGVCSLQLI